MERGRSSWRDRAARLCAWALICVLLVSCVRPPPILPAGQVGTLGVATVTFPPRINLKKITEGKGEGAAKGGGMAVLATGAGGAYAGPFGCLLALVLAPVMCLGGATYGAIAAKPAKKVRPQRDLLKKRISALPYQQQLAGYIGEALKQVPVSVSQEKMAGPVTLDAKVDYHQTSGVDTVLEAVVTDVRLLNRSVVKNRELEFEVGLRLRFYRTSDNALLLERVPTARTKIMSLSAWSRKESGLEADLLALVDIMATKVVFETFSSFDEETVSTGGEGDEGGSVAPEVAAPAAG